MARNKAPKVISADALSQEEAEGLLLLLKRRNMSQRQLEERVGLRKGQLSRMLDRTRPTSRRQFQAMTDVLMASRNGAAVPLDRTQTGVSLEGSAALPNAGGGSAAPGVLSGIHDAHTYAGFWLWGREDPRDAASERVALSPGRAVVSLCKGLGPPQRIKAVRVGDAGALEITTSAGLVARDWCLFIDITKAADAKPGTNVAAMSRRGELIVGELAEDSPGQWVVVIGPDTQEAIDRSKVVGIIVGYQPPRLDVGRVVRHRPPGVVIPPPDDPVVPDAPH